MVRFLDIDPHKCNGCMSCVIACAQKRGRIANPLLGRIQVMRWEDEGVNVPIVCMHCEDAPCQRVCPVDALIRDPASQVIRIDYDRCIGCRFCVEACPEDAIRMDTGEVAIVSDCREDFVLHIDFLLYGKDDEWKKGRKERGLAERERINLNEPPEPPDEKHEYKRDERAPVPSEW